LIVLLEKHIGWQKGQQQQCEASQEHVRLLVQEAKAAWQAAIDGFSPADDLQVMEDAIGFKRNPETCNKPAGRTSLPVPIARAPQVGLGVAGPMQDLERPLRAAILPRPQPPGSPVCIFGANTEAKQRWGR
jgi:hypothetical protein